MTLSVAALRIATVKALDGATSAGARVFDSVEDPRQLLGEEAYPAIVVYADSGRRDVRARDLFGAAHTVDLTIDLFVARAAVATAGDGQETITLEFAAVDAAYDNYLRCLSYEVEKVLLAGDGTWPELWREFFIRGSEREQSEWMRGAAADKSSRFAFLRNVYRAEVIDDPTPGQALPSLWDRFFAALEADAEFTNAAVNLGAYMRKLVTRPAVPTWRAAQSELGVIAGVPASLGFGDAVDPPGSTEPAAAVEIDIEDKDTGETAVANGSGDTVLPPP